MDREEHLQWAKRRALAYLDVEHNVKDAVASMTSDLQKHPEHANNAAIPLGVGLLLLPTTTEREIRKWIEGFN